MATILVADDNSNIQKMVSLAFQEKGIRVVAVGNGEAACRKVPEVRPDLVLADVFMPVRNGYEVCEFVKRDPEFAETPVVLLVGAFDPLDEKEAARVGANGVLKKPFVPPEPLISLVNSLLNRSESAQADPEPQKPADHSNVEYATKIPFVAPAKKTSPAKPKEFQFSSSSEEMADEVQTAPPVIAVPEAPSTEQDDLGPENEWAQRRKAMDYEIDAADSANLVERLAGESDGSSNPADGEILASNKHLPFGGANIPEISKPNKWAALSKVESEPTSDQTPSHPAEMTVEPAPIEETPSYTYEGSAPDLDSPDPNAKVAGSLGPSELLGGGQDVIPFRPPERDLEQETVETPSANEGEESTAQSEVVTWPLQEDGQAEKKSRATGHWMDAISGASSSANSPTDDAEIEIVEPSTGFSEESHSDVKLAGEQDSAQPPEKAEESAATAAASESEEADAPTVDDVVARVISKLEPQLHQALANGVLRPLVEELLNEKKKK